MGLGLASKPCLGKTPKSALKRGKSNWKRLAKSNCDWIVPDLQGTGPMTTFLKCKSHTDMRTVLMHHTEIYQQWLGFRIAGGLIGLTAGATGLSLCSSKNTRSQAVFRKPGFCQKLCGVRTSPFCYLGLTKVTDGGDMSVYRWEWTAGSGFGGSLLGLWDLARKTR